MTKLEDAMEHLKHAYADLGYYMDKYGDDLQAKELDGIMMTIKHCEDAIDTLDECCDGVWE